MHVVQDSEIHSPTAWRRDLAAAGWEEINSITYRDPEGNLWRGPYGAWRELQRRVQRMDCPNGCEQSLSDSYCVSCEETLESHCRDCGLTGDDVRLFSKAAGRPYCKKVSE